MKGLWLQLILILIIGVGCATTTVQIGEDNTFTLRNPDLDISISPEYEYIGEVIDKKSRKDRRYHYYGYTRLYGFVKADPNSPILERVVIINVYRSSFSWDSSQFKLGIKNIREEGECVLDGKNYTYYASFVRLKRRNKILHFLGSKGYVVPPKLFMKYLVRITGGRHHIALLIYYFERVGTGVGTSSLTEFDENFRNALGADCQR